MVVLAGAFGTFALFLLLGLGALAVTALLDRSLGKERALFGYAALLLLLTFVLGGGAAIRKSARPKPVVAKGSEGLKTLLQDVDVAGDRVRVRLLPTFLGCPALEVMRSEAANAVRALGAEPEVEVVVDEDWSTDRITEAGRRKLRRIR